MPLKKSIKGGPGLSNPSGGLAVPAQIGLRLPVPLSSIQNVQRMNVWRLEVSHLLASEHLGLSQDMH